LIIGDAVGADLLGSKVGRDVDRDLIEAKFAGGSLARMADDENALAVDDDRLPEPERLNARSDGVDRGVVVARIAVVGPNLLG
jgi:hypothetical protein